VKPLGIPARWGTFLLLAIQPNHVRLSASNMFDGLICKFGGVLGPIGQISLRARRGQITCPQDEPVDSHCVVRDLPTAPRSTPSA
jgi:hypothetical protein